MFAALAAAAPQRAGVCHINNQLVTATCLPCPAMPCAVQPAKPGRRGRPPVGSYSDALLQDHDMYGLEPEAVQRPPPDPAVLQALAVREQQHVCLQRVRYELERVRQLIDMVRKKEKVKWQVRLQCWCRYRERGGMNFGHTLRGLQPWQVRLEAVLAFQCMYFTAWHNGMPFPVVAILHCCSLPHLPY
jgi:hypothetical protein